MKRHLKLSVSVAAVVAALAIAPFVPKAFAAVVNTYGTGEVSSKATAANPVAVPEVFAAAHVKQISSAIVVGSTDSVNSIYHIGFIPTSAIIDPASLVYSPGITGLSSMSFGFAANPNPVNFQIGTWAALPTALVNAADWHTSGSFSLTGALTTAQYNQQVWQLLGLSLDPGGVVELIATVNNAPSAGGTLVFNVKYGNFN